jgi:uncharacterized protein (DUF488 family)
MIAFMAEFDAFTMGFSIREWQDTVDILNAYSIQCLIDIRTLPGSKRTPQFNLEHLQAALPKAGVEYIHMKELGGLRKPRKDSVNDAWRNDSFRAYADYMQSAEFQAAIARLEQLIRQRTSVYVCTEAVFWRCHRQLVSDALLIRGFRVGHIFSATKVEAHKLTEFACVNGVEITYPKVSPAQQGILDGCD